jgi:hypothetical protein
MMTPINNDGHGAIYVQLVQLVQMLGAHGEHRFKEQR